MVIQMALVSGPQNKQTNDKNVGKKFVGNVGTGRGWEGARKGLGCEYQNGLCAGIATLRNKFS